MASSQSDSFRVLRLDELSTLPNRPEEVATGARANGSAAGGAQLTGIWLPLIGVSVNTVTIATNWKAEPPSLLKIGPASTDAVVQTRTRIFDVLARGQTVCDPAKGGIYTHRWFVVRPGDVDHLTQSSVDAWKYSEADTDMRVVGFWRSRETGTDNTATILMIVYYPDLTAWEASRYWKPKPPDAAQPNRQVWGEMFRKRRDILLNSWVTVHRPV
jgi:hypothetical protein